MLSAEKGERKVGEIIMKKKEEKKRTIFFFFLYTKHYSTLYSNDV